jgi:hypothetical protein
MQWLTRNWLGSRSSRQTRAVSSLAGAFVWEKGALQIPRLRSPGFPVGLVGVGEPHAAFLTESRTRSHGWSHVQEIRVGMTSLSFALP